MTNTAMINEVENRMNYDTMGNIVKFPVSFKNSKEMFAELDAVIIQITELQEKARELETKANDEMMREYIDAESYRIAHEFLSASYKNQQIGDGVLDNLNYGNSRAIQDHEGRWFRTIKDCCKYHGVKLATFYNRRRHGLSLEQCLCYHGLPWGTTREVD